MGVEYLYVFNNGFCARSSVRPFGDILEDARNHRVQIFEIPVGSRVVPIHGYLSDLALLNEIPDGERLERDWEIWRSDELAGLERSWL